MAGKTVEILWINKSSGRSRGRKPPRKRAEPEGALLGMEEAGEVWCPAGLCVLGVGRGVA